MLLLPPNLAKFSDHLAATTAPPGGTLTRQDAIRNVLGKLMVEMGFSPTPQKGSGKTRSKASK